MDSKFCSGCRDDFYNGHNPNGITECWKRKVAKREVYRLVPVDLPPPYLHIKAVRLPTCYQKSGYVKVKREALDTRGFWKS